MKEHNNNITDKQFTVAIVSFVLWVFAGGISFTLFLTNEGGMLFGIWTLITIISFLLWKLENIENESVNQIKNIFYSPLFLA